MFDQGALFMHDFQPSRLEQAAAAKELFDSLEVSERIEVACDYTGKSKVVVTVGRSNEGPFVFADDSSEHHSIMMDQDEVTLFSKAVLGIRSCQESVNPDPHSPSYFEPSMDPSDLATEIAQTLGVEVQVDYL